MVVVWQGAINHNQKNPVDLAQGDSIGPDAHVWQWINGMSDCSLELLSHGFNAHSATGTRTRVARVRAEYPSQLDYSGLGAALPALLPNIQRVSCLCQKLKGTATEWLRHLPVKPVGCPRAGSNPTGVQHTSAPSSDFAILFKSA